MESPAIVLGSIEAEMSGCEIRSSQWVLSTAAQGRRLI